MAVQKGFGISAEEYLAGERASTGRRSEFFGGHISEMPGEKRIHVKIVANLIWSLGNALSGSRFDVYPNELRLSADLSDKYFYPDIAVACEGAQFLDDRLDTLLNPVAVIEVLSDSTEATDKSVKSDAYRAIPSLMHYVMVDS